MELRSVLLRNNSNTLLATWADRPQDGLVFLPLTAEGTLARPGHRHMPGYVACFLLSTLEKWGLHSTPMPAPTRRRRLPMASVFVRRSSAPPRVWGMLPRLYARRCSALTPHQCPKPITWSTAYAPRKPSSKCSRRCSTRGHLLLPHGRRHQRWDAVFLALPAECADCLLYRREVRAIPPSAAVDLARTPRRGPYIL